MSKVERAMAILLRDVHFLRFRSTSDGNYRIQYTVGMTQIADEAPSITECLIRLGRQLEGMSDTKGLGMTISFIMAERGV